jgi:hypothetical protein
VITVGSDGSVITEGRCGNAPGDGELVDGVPMSVVVVGVFDVVPVSVGAAVGAAVVVGVVVLVGVVVVVVTAAGFGRPWTSRMLP